MSVIWPDQGPAFPGLGLGKGPQCPLEVDLAEGPAGNARGAISLHKHPCGLAGHPETAEDVGRAVVQVGKRQSVALDECAIGVIVT